MKLVVVDSMRRVDGSLGLLTDVRCLTRKQSGRIVEVEGVFVAWREALLGGVFMGSGCLDDTLTQPAFTQNTSQWNSPERSRNVTSRDMDFFETHPRWSTSTRPYSTMSSTKSHKGTCNECLIATTTHTLMVHHFDLFDATRNCNSHRSDI